MNKYFDKIYCINTIGDDVRWNNMLNEFDKIGVDSNDVEKVSEPFPDDVNTYESLNNVWIKIATDAKKNNYEKILVLEDDAQFINFEAFDKFTEDLEKYGSDWDLFHLGGLVLTSIIDLKLNKPLNLKCSTYLKKYPEHLKRLTNNLVEINNGFVALTHSIAIRNTAFDKMLEIPNFDNRKTLSEEELETNKKEGIGVQDSDIVSTDNVLQRMFQQPDEYNTYLAFPSITIATPNISNLTKNAKRDWAELTQPMYRALLKVEPINKD